MKKNVIRYCVMFIIFICIWIGWMKDAYADYNIVASENYEICYNDLITDSNLYCVAKGMRMGGDNWYASDNYMVDSAFKITAGNIKRKMSFFSTDYGGLQVKATDWESTLINNSEAKEKFYKLQYKLCNNNKMGRGYFSERQKAIWKYWNFFATMIQTRIYENTSFPYIIGIDSVEENEKISDDRNFDKESQIYSDILIRNETKKSASITDIKTSKKETTQSVKFKYSGIITGIYDLNGNHIDAFENGKTVNLVNWGVGDNTSKTITVSGSLNGIIIQIASTDTELFMYHLQNKSVYTHEGKSQIDWGTYDTNKMGQDLIASYYTKTDDITKTITFDGSNGQNPLPQNNTFNITIQKLDYDNNNNLNGVKIRLYTNGGWYGNWLTTGNDGKVTYSNLNPGTYDVYEENNIEGYQSGELYVGQIRVGSVNYWEYNAGISIFLTTNLNEDGTVNFAIYNKKITGSITITKRDKKTYESIPRNSI